MKKKSKQSIYLIVKNLKVVEILKLKTSTVYERYLKTGFSIYIWAPSEEKDELSYEVGSELNPFYNKSLLLIKRSDKVKKRKFSFKERDAFEDSILENWFRGLTKEKIEKVKEESVKITEDMDQYYRCYHHSFKMYTMRERSFQLFALINYLTGQVDHEGFETEKYLDLMKKADLYSFLLRKNMEKMIKIPFTTHQNDQDLWYEDASYLLGSMLLLKKTLESFIHFSEDYINKKGIFYEPDRRILTDYEALVIDCFLPIAGLRTIDSGKIIEKVLSYAINT